VYADVSRLGIDETSPLATLTSEQPEEGAPHLKGFMFIDCNKAAGAGLHSRPLNDTIRDILTSRETSRLNEELKAGIDRDKEQRLLRKWHETH